MRSLIAAVLLLSLIALVAANRAATQTEALVIIAGWSAIVLGIAIWSQVIRWTVRSLVRRALDRRRAVAAMFGLSGGVGDLPEREASTRASGLPEVDLDVGDTFGDFGDFFGGGDGGGGDGGDG